MNFLKIYTHTHTHIVISQASSKTNFQEINTLQRSKNICFDEGMEGSERAYLFVALWPKAKKLLRTLGTALYC